MTLEAGAGGELTVERNGEDNNKGQSRRGEEKIHGCLPERAWFACVRRTLSYARYIAMGVPKCSRLHNWDKCMDSGHFWGWAGSLPAWKGIFAAKPGSAQGSFWEKVFPPWMAKRFH